MEVLGWEAENFFRYEQLSVNLSCLGRLVLIDGKNHDFATASSNGSGKSSLIEALGYGLFGKTLRALDGKDAVVRPGSDGCRVRVGVQLPEHVLEITRYRKHKKHGNAVQALLDGEDVVRGRDVHETEAKIEKLLGFDFDLFKRAVVIHSRMTESFATLNDRYLKFITERLLGMPDFQNLQGRVKDRLTALGTRVDVSRAKLETARQLLTAEQGRLVEYERLDAEFDSERQENLANLGQLIEKAEQERRTVLADAKTLIDRVAVLEVAVKAETDRVQGKSGELGKLEQRIEKLSVEVAGLETRQTELRRLEQKYRRLSGVCPECEQQISQRHLTAKLSGLKVESEQVQTALKDRQAKLEQARAELRARRADAELATINSGVKRAELVDAKARMEALSDRGKEKVERLDRLQQEEKTLRAKKNPYRQLLLDARRKVPQLEAKVLALEARAVKIGRVIPYYEFWKRGFGPDGIRSYALDGITPVLNQLANMYLEILTDGNMLVELSTVSLTKSGEYRDKFSVSVVNSNGSPALSSDSDGEIACVDLALNLAIADVLDSRIPGGGIGLLFIDQQLDLLDEVRGHKAVQLLGQRLDPAWCKANGLLPKRHVLVISHRDPIKDQFDAHSVINVEKRDGVCRVA